MVVYGDPPEGTLEGLPMAVFGLGKMGLPLAAVLADQGARVHGVDLDEAVVEEVNAGETHVSNEPGLADLLQRHGGDRLTATTDGAAAAAQAQVHTLLVPTLVDDSHEPILEPVLEAGSDVASGIEAGDLVVLESTVPPGTTAETLAEVVTPADRDLRPGEDFGIAHCPERTYAGRVIQDLTQSYPKVVGGIDSASTEAAAAIYEVFNEPGVIELPSATAAEAVKVFEGTYRDVNIALANELALACEEWGLDSEAVFSAANTQPFCDVLEPGIGVGGHCIPVYPHFVRTRATRTPLVESARQINDGMPAHALSLLEGLLDERGRELGTARILVMGVCYRAGVDETRNAPAVSLIEQLVSRGATVFAHDPDVSDADIFETGAEPVAWPTDPDDLDGVVLATGHEIYTSLDLDALADGMRTPTFVDGRDTYEPEDLEAFTSATIGDGSSKSLPQRRITE